jgi:anti-sigma factor RsiW
VSCEQLKRDLDTYVDGELDLDTATSVRSHLAKCADCRRVAAGREALRRLVRAAPYYPAPARLRARAEAQGRTTSMRRMATWTAAAAVVVLSAAAGVALWRSTTTHSDAIIEEVVDSHVRSLMADHLFDIESTDQHTVKPWFLGKLDFAPPVVDLAAAGFPLVGGRLDYLDGRPVAALVYTRRKHTINVFISGHAGSLPRTPGVTALRGFNVHSWSRRGLSFWAVSDLNDAELAEFIRAFQGS